VREALSATDEPARSVGEGCEQEQGSEYAATDLECISGADEDRFAVELVDCYPDATGLSSLGRTIALASHHRSTRRGNGRTADDYFAPATGPSGRLLAPGGPIEPVTVGSCLVSGIVPSSEGLKP
jgi:hypothetical protein